MGITVGSTEAGLPPHDSTAAQTIAGPRRTSVSVSAVVLTKNGAQRLPACLAAIRDASFADELVVCVDADTTDESREMARPYADRIQLLRTGGSLESALPQMAALCSGDYILRIDDDECTRGSWDKEHFEALVCANDTSHFWLPRRWLVPPGNLFIADDPWFPDLQMRLFRNDPGLVTWPQRIHDRTDVAGRGLVLCDRWIDHVIFLTSSRAERQRKCATYQALRPDHDLSHYYLYESQNPSTLSTSLGLRPALEQTCFWKWPSGPRNATYRIGRAIDFREGGNARIFAVEGWSLPESWGTWTDGHAAVLCLPVETPIQTDVHLIADVRAFVCPGHPALTVRIEYRGSVLAEWSFENGDWDVRSAPIPAGTLASDCSPELTFQILNPASPKILGIAEDQRRLGLAFRCLRLDSYSAVC